MQALAGYEILRQLGPANYGSLYLARPPDRVPVEADEIVLKVLDTSTDPAIFRRVSRELRAFAATQSPLLLTLYEAGQEGDLLYYSMEHLGRGTLEVPTEELSRDDKVRAVADAARAAHALHESGVAHRDIRPGNIWLRAEGAKLGELGLAQSMAPGQTVTGVALPVSLEYLDPGIIMGDAPSRATDIWALGLTLHQAISGAGVYGDLSLRDPVVAFRKVLNTTPMLSEALDAAEREVVAGCLAPRAERYPTAAVLAEDLDRLVSAT